MNFKRSRGRSRKNSTFNVVSNTEKWKNATNKLKRLSNDQAEESDDEDKTADVKDWVKEFFGRMSVLNKEQELYEEVHLNKKQTTILSTLVPDELLIMNNLSMPQSKRFVGVLLMADVSGYTALSEKYNSIGKSGTYRLTVTLNTYLGALVELIYNHGGDIIKFAGDAFLALWKTDQRSFLSHTIHSVICCALVIQHSYATYETDVKVNLKVKLAISAGNLTFATIGSGADMNYVIIGLPIIEAKLAESVCTSGKVSLAPTAWAHCYTRNYDYVLHDDGHVTVNAILYDPRDSDVSKPFAGISSVLRQPKPTANSANAIDSFWENVDAAKNNYYSNLRQKIFLAQEKDIGKYIRLFMIKPVLTQVDAHQPLEYLTEMRQVSILFITLKPAECPLPQLISIIDNSYQITCEIVYKSLGCVNKIILFDKDVMILVIFGLRGFKHESEAQAALKCACIIRKSVSALDGVLRVSIGITTGVVYCGVIGHPLRREFTVIGAIVNKAARLMCYYHNKITCDENTFLKSKMSSNGFTLQTPLKLKGIEDAGKIYEYTEEMRVKELFNVPVILPLLNRSDDIELFEHWLLTPRHSYDSLLYIGEVRIGKTRLMEWLHRCAEKLNFNTCYLNLTSIHCSTPFLAMNQIVNQILDLHEPILGFKKEEMILKLMDNQFDDLCYLNDIVNVRFAYQEGTFSLDKNIRKMKTKKIFQKFCNSIKDNYVIFYDDLQNLDACSWEYIELMFTSSNIFTVFSLNRGKLSPMHGWLSQVLRNENIKKVVLGPLEPQWIAPLACQILDVEAVPTELCKVLVSKCKCMPGTIENFLVHLFSSGALSNEILKKDELNEMVESLEFPDIKKIVPSALHITDQLYLENMQEQNNTEEIKVCTIVNRIELESNISDQNLDALIMMQIDSLTPYQQLLLKIGSVIGNTVSRALLENIMYENDEMMTSKSIKKFFDMKIISCRQAKDKWSNRSNTRMSCISEVGNPSLSCECDFDYDIENNENLPKYAFCKLMRFKNKASRKTCYELLPLNQKKEFHTRICNYLENNYDQKCHSCGGQILLGQSLAFDKTSLSLNNFSATAESCDNVTESREDSGFAKALSTYAMLSQQTADEDIEPGDIVSTTGQSAVLKSNSTNIDDKNKEPADIVSTTGKSAILKSHSTNIEDENKEPADVVSTTGKSAVLKSHSTNIDDEILSRRTTKRVNISMQPIEKDVLKDSLEPTVFDQFRPIIEAKTINDWRELGISDSAENLIDGNKFCKNFIDVNIERGVSAIDFGKCTCEELTIHIYEQIIYHAMRAELKLKAVIFMIKYSYLNLRCNNPDNVILNLTEAEDICVEKKGEIKKSELKKYLGHIYSLRAYAFLISGNLLAAKVDIERASKVLKAKGFKSTAAFKLYHRAFHKLTRKKCPKENSFYTNYILFYNVATLVYSTLEEENIAKASSLVALELAQCVNYNTVEVLDAFSNALQVEMDLGFSDSILEIENIVKVTIKKLRQPIKGDEIYALGKLLMTLFRAEVFRGQIISGIRFGYQAASISRFLHIDSILLDLVPDLFYVLLSRGRVAEAVTTVQLILSLKNKQIIDDCETWYHALCLDMILDGGFQLECIDAIHKYGTEILVNKRYTTGFRRLASGLWVYWLRAGCDKKAKIFETSALTFYETPEECGSLTYLISAMRIAEGMLESLSKKIEDLRKVVHLMELRSVAEKELFRLQKDSEMLEAIYPHWLLLKAHTFNICNLKAAAVIKYSQAYEKAKKIYNHLEKSAILAVSNDSNFWIRNCESRMFPSWRVIKEYVKDSWHLFMYRMIVANLNFS